MARQGSARDEVGTGFLARVYLLFLLTPGSVEVAFLNLAKVYTTATCPSFRRRTGALETPTDIGDRLHLHPFFHQDTKTCYSLPSTSY